VAILTPPGDGVARLPGASELEDEVGTHRAPRAIGAVEIVLGDEALERIGQRGDR